MSLYPVYDPKSFESVDLRKYHIRSIKDVIKFNEFVASRMEEAEFILKKFNNQYATFQSVSSQLQSKLEKQQRTYGAGHPEEAIKDDTDKPQIQSVDKSVEEEHNSLLDEIRGAAAEESLAEAVESNEPLQTVLGKYKVVYGKRGPMYYRENSEGKKVLVSKKDVPQDIQDALLNAIGKGND